MQAALLVCLLLAGCLAAMDQGPTSPRPYLPWWRRGDTRVTPNWDFYHRKQNAEDDDSRRGPTTVLPEASTADWRSYRRMFDDGFRRWGPATQRPALPWNRRIDFDDDFLRRNSQLGGLMQGHLTPRCSPIGTQGGGLQMKSPFQPMPTVAALRGGFRPQPFSLRIPRCVCHEGFYGPLCDRSFRCFGGIAKRVGCWEREAQTPEGRMRCRTDNDIIPVCDCIRDYEGDACDQPKYMERHEYRGYPYHAGGTDSPHVREEGLRDYFSRTLHSESLLTLAVLLIVAGAWFFCGLYLLIVWRFRAQHEQRVRTIRAANRPLLRDSDWQPVLAEKPHTIIAFPVGKAPQPPSYAEVVTVIHPAHPVVAASTEETPSQPRREVYNEKQLITHI